MSESNYIDDFLGGGGGKSAFVKADPEGTTYAGTILDIGREMDQVDPGTGKVKLWDDGTPRKQLPVTLDCPDKKDPADPNDDGARTLYVKGAMRIALRDAVRRSRGKLRVGGWLSVTHTHTAAPERAGLNGEKKYSAEYRPSSPADSFLEQPGDQPPAPAAAPAPAPAAQQPAPVAASAPAEQPAAPAAPSMPGDRPGPGEDEAAAATRLGIPYDLVVAINGLPGGFDNQMAAAMVNTARAQQPA